MNNSPCSTGATAAVPLGGAGAAAAAGRRHVLHHVLERLLYYRCGTAFRVKLLSPANLNGRALSGRRARPGEMLKLLL